MLVGFQGNISWLASLVDDSETRFRVAIQRRFKVRFNVNRTLESLKIKIIESRFTQAIHLFQISML